MILCLAGKKRCGKDTAAESLIRSFNFVSISLAQPLREICSQVFNISPDDFINDALKEKPFLSPLILDEASLAFLITIIEKDWGFPVSKDDQSEMEKMIGFEFKHPRHLLQIIGTDLIRKNIDDNIFLKLADKKIETLPKDKHVVITDCRFSNEREWFKKQGATLMLIKRPNLKISVDSHVSENDLGEDSDYDIIINNDCSIGRFKIEVTEWVNYRLNRRFF